MTRCWGIRTWGECGKNESTVVLPSAGGQETTKKTMKKIFVEKGG